MKLSKREMVMGQKIMAIFMIPLLVLQMSFFNLYLIEVAIADDGSILTTDSVVSSAEEEEKNEDIKIKSEVKEPEEKTAEEETEKEDGKKVEETKTEEKNEDADSKDEKETPELNVTGSKTEKVEPEEKPAIVPDTKPKTEADEKDGLTENPKEDVITEKKETTNSVPNEPEKNADQQTEFELTGKECIDEGAGIKSTTAGDWNTDDDNGIAETKVPVRLGVKYIFPLEREVAVTFTCLPKDETQRKTLKIQRIRTADMKLPSGIVPASEHAFDITTDMKDGEFEYAVTLPNDGSKNVGVSYVERSADELTGREIPKGEIKKSVKEKQSTKDMSWKRKRWTILRYSFRPKR